MHWLTRMTKPLRVGRLHDGAASHLARAAVDAIRAAWQVENLYYASLAWD